MPVWGLAKKSVKVFLNFSFGQYFSQPLDDDQIFLTPKGVGCKDIYFNIEKINAILAERGVPVVICVAYISELIVCLPWSIELNGVDLVIQAVAGGCRPAESDALFNSMISSMTTAAFAAAKAASSSEEWFRNHKREVEEEEDTDEVDEPDKGDGSESEPPGGFRVWLKQFYERLTMTPKPDQKEEASVLDEESKERVNQMFDSLIAQTSIVLRDVNFRVECQLGLPGLNRASSVTLFLHYLSLTNQNTVYPGQNVVTQSTRCAGDSERSGQHDLNLSSSRSNLPTGQEGQSSGEGWSWFWRWSAPKKPDFSNPAQRNVCTTEPTGSLSTMLHKIIRLEGADLFWDLWDTSQGGKRRLSSSSIRNPRSETDESMDGTVAEPARDTTGQSRFIASGPTEENLVASAKLMSLSGGEHTARISMHCPLPLFGQSKITDLTEASGESVGPSTAPVTTAVTNSTPSSFQLRAHVDLGAIVACACPSQFYWLHLFVGQLSQIWEGYSQRQESDTNADVSRSVSESPDPYKAPATSDHCTAVGTFRPKRVESIQKPSGAPRSSEASEDELARGLSESELVDLDLSNPDEISCPVSPLIDSKLFWSCLTNENDPTAFEADSDLARHSGKSATGMMSSPSSEPVFSMAANVLCVAFVAFYEDESASRSRESVSQMERSMVASPRVSIMRSYKSPKPHTRCETGSEAESEVGSTGTSPCGSFKENEMPESPSQSVAGSVKKGLAGLPGPFFFFSRFDGLRPWRQPVKDQMVGSQTSSTNQRSSVLRNGPDPSAFVHVATPMRIDRNDVDTGRMTPSVWVANLRRQFAELASPRDHICIVGGLWHIESCSRRLPVPPVRSLVNSPPSGQTPVTEFYTQLDFSAQLFGIEVSECLFPDSLHSGSPNELEPKIIEILSFPDRLKTPGDRPMRSTPRTPAVKTSGVMNFYSDAPTVKNAQFSSRLPPPKCEPEKPSLSVNSFNTEIGFCHVDVDLSLSDRLYRITDALAAATEAVTKFMPFTMELSTQSSAWWQGGGTTGSVIHRPPPSALREGYPLLNPRCNRPTAMTDPILTELDAPTQPLPDLCDSSPRLNAVVSCGGFEVLIRIPVPLEAVKLSGSGKVADLRTKLWSTGTPLWLTTEFNSPPSDVPLTEDCHQQHPKVSLGLGWWRRTLRSEYLHLHMEKITCTYNNSDFAGNLVDAGLCMDAHQTRRGSFKTHETGIQAVKTSPVTSSLQVSMRFLSVFLMSSNSKLQTAPLLHLAPASGSPDLITITVQFAPPGRQDLVERPNDQKELTGCEDDHVFSFSGQRFEMGVDLASIGSTASDQKQVRRGSALEWSLWKRAGPKNNRRTPFVILRNFLQDAPKAHSKQTTYYPGNTDHMNFYRVSASEHARLLVRCRIPVALVNVENKRVIELVYLRLMYDLLLWNSLLPNDRRLRATLTHQSMLQSEEPGELDYRYWFFSDPAPLACIYAHPDAAREAAALEATSAVNYDTLRQPTGLHFHPVDSEDEESDDDDEFDPALESIREGQKTDTFKSTLEQPGSWKAHHSPAKSVGYPLHPSRDVPSCTGGRSAGSLRDRHQPKHSSGSDEENAANTSSTTVQHQSWLCAQLDCGTMELRIHLPTQGGTPTGNSPPNVILFTASDAIAFAEAGHDGDPNLNYATMELNKLAVFFTANHLSNGCAPSPDGSRAGEIAGNSSAMWWPGIVHLPWQSIGYPNLSTSGENETTSADGNEPMLSLAIEHHQTQRPNQASGTMIYRDDLNLAVRLQDACLVHWPHLESTMAEDVDRSALPLWLIQLLEMLETPSVDLIRELLPGYQLPDTLLIQHCHLDRVGLTWSTPELELFGSVHPVTNLTPRARSIRAFIGVESASVTVNTASETVPMNGADGGSSSPGLGMLIMTFLKNVTVFLCPIAPECDSTVTFTQSHGIALTPAGFLSWLKSLKLSDCVCVADLDHLELRCFSDPMRVWRQQLPPGSDLVPVFITRIDVRSTNNLLRLHTCADSLVALQCLFETLSGSSPCRPSGQTKHTELLEEPQSLPGTLEHGVRVTKISAMNRAGVPSSKVSAQSISSHDLARRSPMDTQFVSGSTSSVEDLLQGAISEVDSPHSPMLKTSRVRETPVSSKLSEAGLEPQVSANAAPPTELPERSGTHRSPEPRPCRTQRTTRQRVRTTKSERYSGSNVFYPPRQTHLREESDSPNIHLPGDRRELTPSPGSSPNDFVIVKPSMVPSRSPAVYKDKIRYLLPVNSAASMETASVPLLEVRDNYYPAPSSASTLTKSRVRMHRLFSDPSSVYPRANLALTFYNFSLEWNIYGGTDLLNINSNDRLTPSQHSPHATRISTPEHGDRPSPISENRPAAFSGRSSADAGSSKAVGVSSAPALKQGCRFHHDRSAAAVLDSPRSTGSPNKASVRVALSTSSESSRLDGESPTIPNRSPITTLYTRGGRSRDLSKCVSIRVGNLYFRHATFPANAKKRSTSAASEQRQLVNLPGEPASRHILNIGSLIVVDQVATSKINRILYSYDQSVAGRAIPHSVGTPIFRVAAVCWRTESGTDSSKMVVSDQTLCESSSPDSASIRSAVDSEDSNLELEAKISVRPLRVNLDQNTLMFIQEFQLLYNHFSILLEPVERVPAPNHSVSVPSLTALTRTHPGPVSPISETLQNDSDSPGGTFTTPARPVQFSSIPAASERSHPSPSRLSNSSFESPHQPARSNVFIRKVTFSPDLPIRLDYHGRRMDPTGGSLQGFWLMLLQLHNGELKIPRRVYQRGYPSVDRLVEEVVADLRATLSAQLPQMIATSIGPMYEVTQFMRGLWDLVYQPVQSLYRDSRTASSSLDSYRGYLGPYDGQGNLDLSYCDLNYLLSPPSVTRPGTSGFIHGLRRGARSFSASTLWATLQLSIQGVRTVQSIMETAYDLVTPGPALRSRQMRMRQPADLREGFGNALNAMTHGFQMITEDLSGATRLPSEVEVGYKGPAGMVGDVIRQIPPTIVAPFVTGCEVTANILGGLRNQLRPEAKAEDEQIWKDTHGL